MSSHILCTPTQTRLVCLTDPCKSFILPLDDWIRKLLKSSVHLKGINIYELLTTCIGPLPNKVLDEIIEMSFLLMEGEHQIISEQVKTSEKIFEYGALNSFVYDWSCFFPLPATMYELTGSKAKKFQVAPEIHFVAYYTKDILMNLIEEDPNSWLIKPVESYDTIEELKQGISVQGIEQAYNEIVRTASHDIFKFCVGWVAQRQKHSNKWALMETFIIPLDQGFNASRKDLFYYVNYHEVLICYNHTLSPWTWKGVSLSRLHSFKPNMSLFMNSISLGKENITDVICLATPLPTILVHLILFCMM